MPKAPRGKRVLDTTGRFTVIGKAPNGQAEPYFDRTRGVWVAPWRRADGKVGRPTGRTRALAEASRDRHQAEATGAALRAPLTEGFCAQATVSELARWWVEHVARHRVRATTFATYRKQMSVVEARLGHVPVRALRAEQVTSFVSALIDAGSASRARNVRTLLVQVLDQAVSLGLAPENVARKVRPPRVPRTQRRTLTPVEVGKLLGECDERFAAAIALCFVQGWRVSEALGLAWQDLDLDAGPPTPTASECCSDRRRPSGALGVNYSARPRSNPYCADTKFKQPTAPPRVTSGPRWFTRGSTSTWFSRQGRAGRCCVSTSTGRSGPQP
jgi:hypothetical protein